VGQTPCGKRRFDLSEEQCCSTALVLVPAGFFAELRNARGHGITAKNDTQIVTTITSHPNFARARIPASLASEGGQDGNEAGNH
jgi:hypothetical protein